MGIKRKPNGIQNAKRSLRDLRGQHVIKINSITKLINSGDCRVINISTKEFVTEQELRVMIEIASQISKASMSPVV